MFPVVYSLSHCKEATVADCLVGNDGHAVWDILFLRAANDWELEDFSASSLFRMGW